ncbi:MAG: tyrosine-type recombinase/integrase [Armatimonadota bacterium]
MLDDLLAGLEATTPEETPTSNPAHLPLRVLADWFLADCTARNLQPRTVQFYRLKLLYLLTAAGDRAANDITTHQLRLLVQHYWSQGKWGVGNMNHTITTWKVFFNFLEQEGILTDNPSRRIEKLKGEQRIPEPYSEEEMRRFLAAVGTGFVGARDKAMLLVLLDTGIRAGEFLHLTTEDVDFTLCQLRVFGKGRKERMVPFSPPVRRALLKYLAFRQALKPMVSALWLSDEGEPSTEWSLVGRLRQLAKKAGVSKAHMHRFRHTFASLYIANGGNPAHLQRLLGHTSAAMTQRYTHLSDCHTRDDFRAASPVTQLLGPRWKA